jgi:hypothetical protein
MNNHKNHEKKKKIKPKTLGMELKTYWKRNWRKRT